MNFLSKKAQSTSSHSTKHPAATFLCCLYSLPYLKWRERLRNAFLDMPCNMHRHWSWAKEMSAKGWPAPHIHWHGQNMCHKHPQKTKSFWENQCLLLLPASRILSYPCWFSLHGYKLSHPVNTQPDMKISTHFVQLLTLPFTASASSTVIQTLWLEIPCWQVPTLILNKAGLASNQPTEGGFSFVSAM